MVWFGLVWFGLVSGCFSMVMSLIFALSSSFLSIFLKFFFVACLKIFISKIMRMPTIEEVTGNG